MIDILKSEGNAVNGEYLATYWGGPVLVEQHCYLVFFLQVENITMQEGCGVNLDPGDVWGRSELRSELDRVVTIPGVDQLQ